MKHALSCKTTMGTSYQYNMGIMALLIRRSYFSNKTIIICLPFCSVAALQ